MAERPPMDDLPEVRFASQYMRRHAQELGIDTESSDVARLDGLIDRHELIPYDEIPRAGERILERSTSTREDLRRHLRENQNDEVGVRRLELMNAKIEDIEQKYLPIIRREYQSDPKSCRQFFETLQDAGRQIKNLWPTAVEPSGPELPGDIELPPNLPPVTELFGQLEMIYRTETSRSARDDGADAASELRFHRIAQAYHQAQEIVQSRLVERPDPEGDRDDRIRRQLAALLETVRRETIQSPADDRREIEADDEQKLAA